MGKKMEARTLNDGTKMLLSSDEWQMLEIYRSLDDDWKKCALRQIEVLTKACPITEQPAQPDKIIDFQKQKEIAEGRKDGK